MSSFCNYLAPPKHHVYRCCCIVSQYKIYQEDHNFVLSFGNSFASLIVFLLSMWKLEVFPMLHGRGEEGINPTTTKHWGLLYVYLLHASPTSTTAKKSGLLYVYLLFASPTSTTANKCGILYVYLLFASPTSFPLSSGVTCSVSSLKEFGEKLSFYLVIYLAITCFIVWNFTLGKLPPSPTP
jgi:hypothetical protein